MRKFCSLELQNETAFSSCSNNCHEMEATNPSSFFDNCRKPNTDIRGRSVYKPYLLDEIFTPNVKPTDLNLCFLHKSSIHKRNEEIRDMPSGLRNMCRYHGFKFNTIIPSKMYHGKLCEQHFEEEADKAAGRYIPCLSKSLSNVGNIYSDEKQISNDNHTDNSVLNFVSPKWSNYTFETISTTKESYTNIKEVSSDNHNILINLKDQQFYIPTNTLSRSCDLNNVANQPENVCVISDTNSGLNNKLKHAHAFSEPQYSSYHIMNQYLQPKSNQYLEPKRPAENSKIFPWKHSQLVGFSSSGAGTGARCELGKNWLAVSSILLIIGAASVAVPLALREAASAPFDQRLQVAIQLLEQVPLIDGHNDLPWNIRKFLHNKLNDFNFDADLRNVMPWARSNWSHTDLLRLKRGRISAQFWAAYVPCEAQHRDAVQLTLEQIDVIKRLTERYSPQLTTCVSSEDIIKAHKNQQLCSLTGVEGGHSLGGSLAVLRILYAMGVRYMTLTSTCHTPWADSSYADAPNFNTKHGGLTMFGKTIVREMNRLGMMIDLSHVSTGTMRDALGLSQAPVIFSHSSAYKLCNSSRNVQDEMLQMLTKNGGIVMVNFYSMFLSCSESSTVRDAIAHINHIKRVAGVDHVGLGAGYDGINSTPKDLEDVSSYPKLFAELLREGWSIDDLTKLAGGNFLRVMQEVERIRDKQKLAGVKPFEDQSYFRVEDPYNCTSN